MVQLLNVLRFGIDGFSGSAMLIFGICLSSACAAGEKAHYFQSLSVGTRVAYKTAGRGVDAEN